VRSPASKRSSTSWAATATRCSSARTTVGSLSITHRALSAPTPATEEPHSGFEFAILICRAAQADTLELSDLTATAPAALVDEGLAVLATVGPRHPVLASLDLEHAARVVTEVRARLAILDDGCDE